MSISKFRLVLSVAMQYGALTTIGFTYSWGLSALLLVFIMGHNMKKHFNE